MKKTGIVSAILLVFFMSYVSAGTINVDDNGTGCVSSPQVTPYSVVYCNIQDAIDDAVSGDVINVADGVYNEQLIIDKSIILNGINKPKIISPSSRENYRIPESTQLWDPIIFAYGGTEISGVVSGSEVIEATINGFEVDGQNDFKSGRRYAGILGRNADLTIINNKIYGVGVGSSETFGVIIYGDSDVKINYNNITGYSRGGIGVNGDLNASSNLGPYPDPVAEVKGNIVTGPGKDEDVIWAPNGIQISYGAIGIIENNEVSGNGWPGTEWAGSGIIIVDNSNVIIKNNLVFENEQAISYGEFWNPASNGMIVGNKVYNNSWGISIFNYADNILIINNSVEENLYDGIDVYSYGGSWVGHYPTNIVVNYNNIIGNGLDGLWTDVLEEVNGKYNNWGSCDGPSGDGPGNGDSVIGNVSYEPWLGICFEDKTNVNCASQLNNITLEAKVFGEQLNDVLFSYTINGANYNKIATKDLVKNSSYFITIPSSELIGGINVNWNIYANDSYGNVYESGWETFYVRMATYLGVNPWPADGLNNWFITEPTFSLTRDSNDTGIIYYQWDSSDTYAYNGSFSLENIPNPPNATAGILELNWWTQFSCGKESVQSNTFYIDLTNPLITNLNPGNGGAVYNNFKPEISAYLDEVYQSNSGIDLNSIQMWVNDVLVSAIVENVNSLNAIVKYNPLSNLSLGTNNVTVNASDNSGRNSILTWFFDINITAASTMIVYSPIEDIYSSRNIPFKIELSDDVKLSYINYDDKTPKETILCNDCDEYGISRKKTKILNEGENNISIIATDNFGQVNEKNIVLFIDSKKPRILKTEPRRNAVINGSEFYIKYTEENLENITLFIKSGLGTETFTKEDCESGKNKECIFNNIDLSSHEDEWIEYWFVASDSINNEESRKTEVKIDTISPELVVYMPENGNSGKKVQFNITITSLEKSAIEYIDLSEGTKATWRTLCTNCNEYGESKSKTKLFKSGNHNLEFRAVDKAGNSDIEDVSITVI